METAINAPFDSNEVKDIACAEFRARLDQLSPIQGAKEYASFDLDFQVKIRVRRAGDTEAGKETLAWGSIHRGTVHPDDEQGSAAVVSSFTSGDPNTERQSRGMPLTVETKDGKGGVVRRRVTVKE